ncbi:hypothetical protein A2130_00115 [Candidatus Woesebacteria bacterium GWC2_33_12]|uniref:DUF3800 domain-containing protein n=1 Tax=Candidatus Woesebacteria bacterium GW2011_GWB1_33_22 TaxID=1618566 RepID=A0A0G0CN11_9BACT|nr:MAG: hypothetical protein UR29_C0010G0013 [Candidatus Woesebacteria bacterium GW2011_GWC2_33_12]KKP42038.1 MAG: hypothetical protein UR33_C0006G0022 [Candidatus Woesebacteria bacterium GW2011_GWA2_33_20]KKP44812.1 MAG: hypothetical protein UR35_C0006G0047 [Candidatus Woesebacteria bacterium GW2011_GWB1_33_22]KKP46631.1 MAG: hypothetical protein UR37_C0006G0081 [Microgenomates group bacterium GW2011_GWC1_33_28]KKP50544.1 MAG: hypothetical protein UR41_C0006G0047 [Candidatus Woesebacteria bact
MITAYIDESGNLADNRPFLITAIVCLENDNIPSRIIKRLRRVLGRKKGKIGKEIKFSNSSDRIKNYFIKRLSNEKLYSLVFVFDKEKKQIKDNPENYAKILNWVIKIGIAIHGWGKVIVDRKFDKKIDQEKLAEEIVTLGLDINKISFVDSKINDGIKLADFVAGFYGQFYNSNKPLPKLILGMVSEERLSWNLLKQKTVVPKGSDAPKKSESR